MAITPMQILLPMCTDVHTHTFHLLLTYIHTHIPPSSRPPQTLPTQMDTQTKEGSTPPLPLIPYPFSTPTPSTHTHTHREQDSILKKHVSSAVRTLRGRAVKTKRNASRQTKKPNNISCRRGGGKREGKGKGKKREREGKKGRGGLEGGGKGEGREGRRY